jgi:hypothetical protein
MASLTLADNFGLNKIQRLIHEADEGSDDPSLEPTFPFWIMGFDEMFFRAEPSMTLPDPP